MGGGNKTSKRRSENASFEGAWLAWGPRCHGTSANCRVCLWTAPCDLMLQSKFDTSAEGTTRVINNNKTSCPQTLKVIQNRFSPPPGWGVRQWKGLGLGRHVLSNLRCQLVLAWGGGWSWRDGCTQLMCHKKIQSVFSWFSEDGY